MLNEKQKAIRKWFRKRNWNTDSENDGITPILISPVQIGPSYCRTENGQNFHCYNKYKAYIDMYPNDDSIDISIENHIVYANRPEKPESRFREPTARITLTREELINLADLIDAVKENLR